MSVIDKQRLAAAKAELAPPAAKTVPAARRKREVAEAPVPSAWQQPPVPVHAKKRASAAAIRSLEKSPGASVHFRRRTLGSLATGAPFEPKTAAALEAIAGAPISEAALTKLYASCVPDARVRLSTSAAQKDLFEYTVTWIDNTGASISTLRRKLKRHEDGSLELFSHCCWTDPQHRGKAISSRVMQEEIALLRALSPHENTRLSLWAGAMNGQRIGPYAWAGFGFELACERGFKTKLGVDATKPRVEPEDAALKALSDLELLRHQLAAFVDRLHAAGTLSAEDRDAMKAAGAGFTKPWELAKLSVEGLRLEVPIGASKQSCALGKAFLLSKDAPRWEGVFLVNQPRSESAKLAASHIAQAIGDADKARAKQEAALKRELASRKSDVRAQAIERIAVDGSRAWIAPLRALAVKKPEHAEAIATAIQKLKHEWQPPRPKIEYSYHSGSGYTPARVEIPRELEELESLDADQLVERIRGENARLAAAALQTLALKSPVDVERVRAEAKGLSERLSAEEQWTQRREAVDILGRLEKEAGIPELIALWPKEEDINVLIAMQRWLDAAETPLAEAPAHELGARVDAMKEEIRLALEELARG